MFTYHLFNNTSSSNCEILIQAHDLSSTSHFPKTIHGELICSEFGYMMLVIHLTSQFNFFSIQFYMRTVCTVQSIPYCINRALRRSENKATIILQISTIISQKVNTVYVFQVPSCQSHGLLLFVELRKVSAKKGPIFIQGMLHHDAFKSFQYTKHLHRHFFTRTGYQSQPVPIQPKPQNYISSTLFYPLECECFHSNSQGSKL